MGVKGLLVALQSVQREVHVSEFRAKRVAIDGYAWLHRAAFAAVHSVVFGKDNRKPVAYCMKRLEMLRGFQVIPLVVFDGRSLPSKAETNAARRQVREAAKEEASELLELGKTSAAYKAMGKAVSITHDLVIALMKECQLHNIECIVAPYEADAQLGYLSHIGYVDAVISEDSDLLLYGCKLVLFKMNEVGGCLCIRSADLPKSGIFRPDQFSEVLSCLAGCDYIESVKGIGLKKGAPYVAESMQVQQENIDPSSLSCPESPTMRLKHLTRKLRAAGFPINVDYEQDLKRALWTFKHQTVNNQNTLARRYPLPSTTSDSPEVFAALVNFLGPLLEPGTATSICYGEVHPHTLEPTGLIRSARSAVKAFSTAAAEELSNCRKPPSRAKRNIFAAGFHKSQQRPLVVKKRKILDLSIQATSSPRGKPIPPNVNVSPQRSSLTQQKQSLGKVLTANYDDAALQQSITKLKDYCHG